MLIFKQQKHAHKVEEQQDLRWQHHVTPGSHRITRQEMDNMNNLQLKDLSVQRRHVVLMSGLHSLIKLDEK